MTVSASVRTSHGDHVRNEVFRDAATMALYVSVVEIAELAAIPESHFAHGRVTGPVGGQLLAILWGTAIGLVLAHWFAFRVAGRAFGGERVTGLDTRIGFAQVGAGMFVAAVSSLPIVLLSDVQAQESVGDMPALLIGIVGYLIARSAGKSRVPSAFFGITALLLGVLVALVKNILVAH